jgi:hypothetical protein
MVAASPRDEISRYALVSALDVVDNFLMNEAQAVGAEYLTGVQLNSFLCFREDYGLLTATVLGSLQNKS